MTRHALSQADEMWKRHANPWSVWTRFAAIPAFALAAWSREWLGWWSLVPIALVFVWLVLNVFVFSPIETPRSWVSKGIYGEKLWLANRGEIPEHYATVQRRLMVTGGVLDVDPASRSANRRATCRC
jgi:hypothetical protein